MGKSKWNPRNNNTYVWYYVHGLLVTRYDTKPLLNSPGEAKPRPRTIDISIESFWSVTN